jgi:hypothetical protein
MAVRADLGGRSNEWERHLRSAHDTLVLAHRELMAQERALAHRISLLRQVMPQMEQEAQPAPAPPIAAPPQVRGVGDSAGGHHERGECAAHVPRNLLGIAGRHTVSYRVRRRPDTQGLKGRGASAERGGASERRVATT